MNKTSWPLAADTEENIYCAITSNTHDLDRPAYGLYTKAGSTESF